MKKTKDKVFNYLKKYYKWFILVVVVLILVVSSFLYLGNKTETISITNNVTKMGEVIELKNVSEIISFSSYLENVYASEGKTVTLNGTLLREIEGLKDSGANIFLIEDDEGNKIQLEGLYNRLMGYLPNLGKTKDLFSVNGTFKRNYKTLYLVINNIEPYTRPPIQIEKITHQSPVTESVTSQIVRPKYPLITNLMYAITGKEITCVDGTKFESCSDSKPMYCSLSGLTKNPGTCDCPEGYVKEGNTCVGICNEKQLYGDCPNLCLNSSSLIVPKNTLSVLDYPSILDTSNFVNPVNKMIDTNVWRIEATSKKCYIGKYVGQYPEKIYCDDAIVSRWETTDSGTIDHRWYTALSSEWNPIKNENGEVTGYKFDKIVCENGQKIYVNKESTSYYVHVTKDGNKIQIEYH